MRPPSPQDEAARGDAVGVPGRQGRDQQRLDALIERLVAARRAEEDLPPRPPRPPEAALRRRLRHVARDLVDPLARRVPLGPSAHLRALSQAAAGMTGRVEQGGALHRGEDPGTSR